MNEFEEEDRKLERWKDLNNKLNERELSLDEYLDYTQTSDEVLNMFIEGYRSGVSQHQFKDLDIGMQKVHIHLLEMAMIITRHRGNMDNYYEMKEIITELKNISEDGL